MENPNKHGMIWGETPLFWGVPLFLETPKYSTQGLFVVRLTIALQEMLVFENQESQKEKDVGTLKGVDHWRCWKRRVTGCLAGGF